MKKIGRTLLVLALMLQLGPVSAEMKALEGSYEMVSFQLVGEPGDKIKIYTCQGCKPKVLNFAERFKVIEKGELVGLEALKKRQGRSVGVIYSLSDNEVTKIIW